MYLKSLTLKGFKSFASSTTLAFEPGICCVVGPNGSGKSNVVDALSWVMGEQGAKALRGGKMQDVIFAGTDGRAPLGRAEVTLTIDNSDGALPIDYSEVSVTRRMFRDGAGEYEINGTRCRLMDVQELLSDSGIGREMHVIVGQGRLAEILESRPEDRRAFVEEAAGVLKHRRRREKAVRKLDAMTANLDRLSDLTAELRRQLKPLGRQAEIARRAATVQADLRDARLRLAADDLVTRRRELASRDEAEAIAKEKHREVAERLEAASEELAEHEFALERLEPEAERAQATWFRLSALSERVSATIRVATERSRNLDEPSGRPSGPDPDELERQAVRAEEQEEELTLDVEEARERLLVAQDELAVRVEEADAAEREHLAAVRAVADRREGLARLEGQVAALRARVESADAEAARVAEQLRETEASADAARAAFEEVEASLAELDATEAALDAHHERARSAREQAESRLADLRTSERGISQEIAGLRARIEALRTGLRRRDGASWLTAHAEEHSVGGAISDVIGVAKGWELALSAALGSVADALTSPDRTRARSALEALRAADAGRGTLLIAGAGETWRLEADLPPGTAWALDRVDFPDDLATALTALLVDVVLVEGLEDALAVVDADPRLRAVTRAGDVVAPGRISGGTGAGPSALEIAADVEDAESRLLTAIRREEEIAAALSGATAEFDEREHDQEGAVLALRESDAAIVAAYDELGRLGQTSRIAENQARRLFERRAIVEEKRRETVVELDETSERLRLASTEPAADEPVDDRRTATAAAVAEVRAVEVEARLAVRTAEERLASVAGRADSLRRSARAERENRAREERARASRRHAAEIAAVVVESGEVLAAELAEATATAARERDELAVRRRERQAAHARVRDDVAALTAEVARMTDAVHRDEMARAEARVRIEQAEEQILETLAIEPDVLVAEYGPDVPLPPSELELREYEDAVERGEQVTRPAPIRFDREEQKRRLRRAERDLAQLGKVNPLALEEFAALEERHAFLATQLDDVKKARADLLDVVAEVDERILRLFTEAWVDVEREFREVFSTLFPGGEGRLFLTDPGDMLTTGIDVEARPPGKKVRRLSLLSGGEKSLTAVAMLVAIFRARPSPFYVMDEVEAALDDTNLRRLIGLFEQLREKSQLIVITHQKPTMDVADVLYGVSMRGDGITRVISQRMRSREERAAVAGAP